MRLILSLTAAVFALVPAGTAKADELEAAGTPLRVLLMQEPADFEIPFYDAFVTAGEDKFTFVVPQGFRLKGDPGAGRLLLCNPEGDCALSFTIVKNGENQGEPMSAEALQAAVLKLHPHAVMLKEFSASTISQCGPGVDIQWKAEGEIYQCERLSLIRTSYGTFIFTACSSRRRFSEAQSDIGLIMATFRASKDGKFRPLQIEGAN